MYQSNDYLKLTKEYLKNMRYHEQALRNLRTDASTLEYELNCAAQSSIEKQSYVRDLKRQDLMRVQTSIIRLENHLQKMRESIHQLSREEQEIIDLVFIRRLTAIETGERVGLCERSVHRHVRSAIENLAAMIFGSVALDDIHFVRA